MPVGRVACRAARVESSSLVVIAAIHPRDDRRSVAPESTTPFIGVPYFYDG